ncbi:MAG: T9SS type A sorting domain-containing protein, partial [Bacteroidales bacterium]
TLVATWDAPQSTLITEDFQGAFPPAGWQRSSSGAGWIGTTNGGSSFWSIPAHTKYAVANDDGAGSSNNGCCDYLITPPVDLTAAPGYVLSFQSYYTGSFSQSAYLEMSTDAGASWTVVSTISSSAGWAQVDVDLSAYSGSTGLNQVWFAFHADDNGAWASGWAVDDVFLSSGTIPVLGGYGIFLDGTLVYQPIAETTYTFDPSTINYGQTYVAGVAGIYSSGFSDLDTYTFTSHFLFPPRNLTGTPSESAAILNWEAPLSGDAPAHATGVVPDYSWIQSSGTLSASGHAGNAAPSVGFTANTDAPSAEVEISYCGANSDAIGTGTANVFMAAARFTTDELSAYYTTKQITKAKIWLAASGTWSNVKVKVWEGGSFGDAGTEVYSEDVTAQIIADDYTIVTLATPVPLVAGNEYWIGYEVTATGGYMMGCDAGPYVSGKGSWIYFSGAWAQLPDLNPALTFNWNIVGVLDDAGSQPAENLLSYNLYRDDVLLTNIPKTDFQYFDLNLLPATYCYDITAVYDLTPYGFPGTTGESIKEGQACVAINYGFPVPFMEDWTTGSFGTSDWTADQNWRIAGQMGNPMPCAEFGWDPPQTDYSFALESGLINSVPMGSSTSVYKIYFDFDMAIHDRTATSNEKLSVEVGSGSTWAKVAEFVNNGDLAFATQHIDITAKAKNRVFQIRFVASGVASSDIYYWLVDNIHVYYAFSPATNLMSNQTGDPLNDVHLTWEAPVGGSVILPGEWIHYDDGVNSDGIGTGGAAEFNVAMRFTPAQLADYDGFAVKKIKFFPREAACTYAVKVWSGADAANLLIEQAVATPTIGDWNEIDLSTFATIDASQELWIGYSANTTTGYPAGCDAGPADAGSGDLLSQDGGVTWVSISTEYGLDYNWNIQGFVEGTGDAPMAALQPIQKILPVTAAAGTFKLDPNPNATAANLLQRTTSSVKESKNTRAITGYNVYRQGTIGDYAVIGNTTALEYNDLNLANDCYNYYVTVVYTEDDGMVNESGPSNIRTECLNVGINPLTSSEVSIYPNPAANSVTINLTDNVRQLTVYNYLGSVVNEMNIVKGKTVTMNTSNYAAGTYTIRFTTANGETFSKKLVIIK